MVFAASGASWPGSVAAGGVGASEPPFGSAVGACAGSPAGSVAGLGLLVGVTVGVRTRVFGAVSVGGLLARASSANAALAGAIGMVRRPVFVLPGGVVFTSAAAARWVRCISASVAMSAA